MFEGHTEARRFEFRADEPAPRDLIEEDLLLESRNPEMSAMLEMVERAAARRHDNSPDR